MHSKFLYGETEKKKQLVRCRCKYEENIKIGLKKYVSRIGTRFTWIVAGSSDGFL
jgi:hypothetical protein